MNDRVQRDSRTYVKDYSFHNQCNKVFNSKKKPTDNAIIIKLLFGVLLLSLPPELTHSLSLSLFLSF